MGSLGVAELTRGEESCWMETEGSSPIPSPYPGLAPNPDLRIESKCMALQGL